MLVCPRAGPAEPEWRRCAGDAAPTRGATQPAHAAGPGCARNSRTESAGTAQSAHGDQSAQGDQPAPNTTNERPARAARDTAARAGASAEPATTVGAQSGSRLRPRRCEQCMVTLVASTAEKLEDICKCGNDSAVVPVIAARRSHLTRARFDALPLFVQQLSNHIFTIPFFRFVFQVFVLFDSR